ncbi:MAG: hypothetical protein LBE95_00340 [Holosporaceae bacterium]|jgi:hypothetical protein|nr:hypothetical protein [Holosporaceae bacterium]
MRGFLFYFQRFLFLGIAVVSLQDFVFANEEDSDDSNHNTDTKSVVRTVVNRLLKINEGISPENRELRAKKLSERARRQKLDKARRRKGNEDGEDDEDDEDNENNEDEDNESEEDGSNSHENSSTATKRARKSKKASLKAPRARRKKSKKTRKNTTMQKKSGRRQGVKHAKSRWQRHFSSYSPSHSSKIFTVKDIRLSPGATNRYLRNLYPAGNYGYHPIGNYKTKYYGRGTPSSIEYKIKSYGKYSGPNTPDTALDEIPFSNEKLTIKPKNYFNRCSSSSGCSGHSLSGLE